MVDVYILKSPQVSRPPTELHWRGASNAAGLPEELIHVIRETRIRRVLLPRNKRPSNAAMECGIDGVRRRSDVASAALRRANVQLLFDATE
ncbi:MAG: hypothetical protein AB1586_01660 [Pseudomonadota bacterium]|jgi:hypothetical protein